MQRISSRHNALVGRFRAAAAGDDPAHLLLDGLHLASEAIAAGVRLDHLMVAAAALDRPELRPLLHAAERAGTPIAAATAPVMSAVSPVRSSSPVVALAARPKCDEARIYRRQPVLVLMACDIQDPGNLGAIVRVAEAAGASGVIAAGAGADPFGWKALRGSMGSALRAPVLVDRSLEHAVSRARHHRCRIVAAVPRDGRSLYDVDLTAPAALLLGGEGRGLSAKIAGAADERITIPMDAPVESLNAAVTAAIVAYEARRQRDRPR
jgi:TrmH family RNA methyltransferase